MTKVYISPLDDTSKRRLIAAVADKGKANGLEAAAKIFEALADHRRRVVGTGELKMAAASLRESAAEIRKAADGIIADLEAQSDAAYTL